jgi:hypothetical protein
MSTAIAPSVKYVWTDAPKAPSDDKRTAERRPVSLPARLTWKDQRGATRFASVVTRDVSEFGVYVECESAVAIPLYRLVQFQLERDVREGDTLPRALRQGRILSAVYRVSPPTRQSKRQGFALRLMVDPKRAAAAEVEDTRATA